MDKRPKLGKSGMIFACMWALAASSAVVAAQPAVPPRARSPSWLRAPPSRSATDDEQSRRLAEEALQALVTIPDPDMEVRARLVLCKYYSDRDLKAAEAQITVMQTLLAQLKNAGLRAGVLTCRGGVQERQGANVEALALYEQAVSTAKSSPDEEMLAGSIALPRIPAGTAGPLCRGARRPAAIPANV